MLMWQKKDGCENSGRRQIGQTRYTAGELAPPPIPPTGIPVAVVAAVTTAVPEGKGNLVLRGCMDSQLADNKRRCSQSKIKDG